VPHLRRIHALSLSGAADPARIDAGARRLRELGFEVTVPYRARAQWRYFAGSDDERLAALDEALRSEADLVLFTRGGYGLSRLLHRIDWDRVAASGKMFCGFSDLTAFSLALLAETGRETLSGPVLAGDFAAEAGPDRSFTEAQWLGVLTALQGGEAWAWPEFIALSGRSGAGAIEGVLWGANLTMIAHLCGTRWLPEVAGGVLVLEDVAEYPYRIERMFWQLKHAGVLDRQAAIVLGEFSQCEPAAGMQHPFVLAEAIEALCEMSPCPVFTGFPFGHVARKTTLPIGRRVRLEVTDGCARLSLPASVR